MIGFLFMWSILFWHVDDLSMPRVAVRIIIFRLFVNEVVSVSIREFIFCRNEELTILKE